MKVIFLLISFLSIILFPQDNLKYYAINAFKDSYLVSFDLEEIDYFLYNGAPRIRRAAEYPYSACDIRRKHRQYP